MLLTILLSGRADIVTFIVIKVSSRDEFLTGYCSRFESAEWCIVALFLSQNCESEAHLHYCSKVCVFWRPECQRTLWYESILLPHEKFRSRLCVKSFILCAQFSFAPHVSQPFFFFFLVTVMSIWDHTWPFIPLSPSAPANYFTVKSKSKSIYVLVSQFCDKTISKNIRSVLGLFWMIEKILSVVMTCFKIRVLSDHTLIKKNQLYYNSEIHCGLFILTYLLVLIFTCGIGNKIII